MMFAVSVAHRRPFPESPASTNWAPGGTTFRLRGKVAVVFGVQGKGLSTATPPLSLVASEDLVRLLPLSWFLSQF